MVSIAISLLWAVFFSGIDTVIKSATGGFILTFLVYFDSQKGTKPERMSTGEYKRCNARIAVTVIN